MRKEIIVDIIFIITIVIPLITMIIYGILDNIKFHKDMRRRIEEYEIDRIKLDNKFKCLRNIYNTLRKESKNER